MSVIDLQAVRFRRDPQGARETEVRVIWSAFNRRVEASLQRQIAERERLAEILSRLVRAVRKHAISRALTGER